MSYEGKEHKATAKSHDEIKVSSLFNSRKTTRSRSTRIKNKPTTLLDSDLPSRHEVKLLAHELKKQRPNWRKFVRRFKLN